MNAIADQWSVQSWPRRHLIDVDQYYKMAEVGLLAPDERVELIEGEVIDMAPIGSRHGQCVDWLASTLIVAVTKQAIVRVQGSIRLNNRSEPLPDLALLKARPDRYRDAHPTPPDVLLIIEVSDSTLRFDLSSKALLYAKSGISEYWVVDIENAKLHCHREPDTDGYRSIATFSAPQVLQAQGLATAQLDLAQLFD